MSRLRKFFKLDVNSGCLLIHAWILLGYYRVALLLLPLRHFTLRLQSGPARVHLQPLTEWQREEARRIGALVATAASVTPWSCHCLQQVLVAHRLLVQRGIAGQFCLGIKRGLEDNPGTSNFAAHAWLQCDELVVNGRGGHESFTVIASYYWGELAAQEAQHAL